MDYQNAEIHGDSQLSLEGNRGANGIGADRVLLKRGQPGQRLHVRHERGVRRVLPDRASHSPLQFAQDTEFEIVGSVHRAYALRFCNV